MTEPTVRAGHDPAHHAAPTDHGVVDTLLSLIVAFVLAMTFRGFLVEGFVIPTGSMAPTLLGEHYMLRSPATGSQVPVNIAPVDRVTRFDVYDPMVGPDSPMSEPLSGTRRRMGDRILVFKGLFQFRNPSRFDVMVFTNPTNPDGAERNYIKRLVGLPNEAVWLVDGDVFTASHNGREVTEDFQVRRKPEHIQRAVWQPIFHSDAMVLRPGALPAYDGPPWAPQNADDDHWTIEPRRFISNTAEPTQLVWRNDRRPLNDWNPYNMLLEQDPRIGIRRIPTSDLRIAAAIIPERDGLSTTLQLHARSHIFEFEITDGTAEVRMRHEDSAPDHWDARESAILPVRRAFSPDRPTNVEFWHVDQQLTIFVDGRRVIDLPYDWTPEQRLHFTTGLSVAEAIRQLPGPPVRGSRLTWRFSGSRATLTRVRVDRDLYYQPSQVTASRSPEQAVGPGAATHPDTIPLLNGDQFFMLGDNSPASLDSRSWGESHPLVATQIDDTAFVVHRKLLLGKAWVVYFPAPLSWTDDGLALMPDFGRMRFIR